MQIFFAPNLQFLRSHCKIDIQQMADQFKVSPDRWIALEEGRETPKLELLIQISDFFHQPIDRLLKTPIGELYHQIKDKKLSLILLDVDGTLTDGGMYYGESGDQIKRFDSQDGLAIHRMITRHGMKFGFISAGSTTAIVKKRAKKLGIKRVYCGTRPKIEVATEWLNEMKLDFKQVAYIGDDLNDLPLIKKAGISACPANARPQVKLASHIVLSRKGGNGCVREFIEEVMNYDILK